MSLQTISTPIKDELEEFDKYFKSLMKTDVALLDIVLRYLTKKKGKRIRPILVFLTAHILGEINERTYQGAAMVELLHTATLVHDDVVDRAETRRGLLSINAKWNNKIAVLVGDFLLSKGLLIATEHQEYGFLDITSNAVRRMSEGELQAIEVIKKREITEEIYYRIISDKTAALISTCTQIGATSVTDDRELINKMKEFGENIGMAFQLKDDLFDYLSTSSLIGKPVGNDIREKKITLPLIHSFENSDKSEAKKIKKMISKGDLSNKDVKYIIDYTKEYKGIEYTINVSNQYKQKALDILDELPTNADRQTLIDLAEFVINREN